MTPLIAALKDLVSALPFLDDPVVLGLVLVIIEEAARAFWEKRGLRKQIAELERKATKKEKTLAADPARSHQQFAAAERELRLSQESANALKQQLLTLDQQRLAETK